MNIVDNPPVFMALNLTLFLAGYFLPSLMGLLKSREKRLKLFLVNLLLGWTIVGWMVAFIWAATMPYDVIRPRRQPAAPPG